MNWLAFSYSLSTQSGSTPRVTLWRRLKRVGAIAPTGSVYLLPALDECLEAFQWLAQEIGHAGGEALVMRVEQFEGLDDAQLIGKFNQVRAGEYAELEQQLNEWEENRGDPDAVQPEASHTLERLQRQHAEIMRVDYFQAAAGIQLASRLRQAAQWLNPATETPPDIFPATLSDYQNRTWVTRPRPHVDRLACIWLIHRFIDPHAGIRFSEEPAPDEITFDMSNAHFGHVGNLCTFETMIRAFQLSAHALYSLAEIVHEIDVRDGYYPRPEVVGVDTVLRGWLATGLSDEELVAHGTGLFEGLFASLSSNAI